MTHLHRTYSVPHIVVTSVLLPPDPSTDSTASSSDPEYMTVIGSSLSPTTRTARLFSIRVPSLPCSFVGTGDLFASLMLVRLREESTRSSLLTVQSWLPPPETQPTDLPLARAAEKVLNSMHTILEKTMAARDREVQMHRFGHEFGGGLDPLEAEENRAPNARGKDGEGAEGEVKVDSEADDKGHQEDSTKEKDKEDQDRDIADAQYQHRRFLAETKAAEVRLVRNVGDLKRPVVRFRAEAVRVDD